MNHIANVKVTRSVCPLTGRANQLHVLLRHRLLLQAHDVEGLSAVLEETPANHLAATKGPHLAVSPDYVGPAAPPCGLDLYVGDDVLADLAPVAVGPTVA